MFSNSTSKAAPERLINQRIADLEKNWIILEDKTDRMHHVSDSLLSSLLDLSDYAIMIHNWPLVVNYISSFQLFKLSFYTQKIYQKLGILYAKRGDSQNSQSCFFMAYCFASKFTAVPAP